MATDLESGHIKETWSAGAWSHQGDLESGHIKETWRVVTLRRPGEWHKQVSWWITFAVRVSACCECGILFPILSAFQYHIQIKCVPPGLYILPNSGCHSVGPGDTMHSLMVGSIPPKMVTLVMAWIKLILVSWLFGHSYTFNIIITDWHIRATAKTMWSTDHRAHAPLSFKCFWVSSS